MRYILAALLASASLIPVLPAAAQNSASTSYTVTVSVTPAVTSVGLSNTTVSTVGPNNAGVVVGALSVATNPSGGNFTGHITVGGTNGSQFAVTNGGSLPCNLVVGSSNIAAGTYQITLSAQ
jgi:hypothetical protein